MPVVAPNNNFLLAIDKQGNLVVIENKLDDSGRDVVWQCLKYASYCSTLSKAQVADIFGRYLERTGSAADPRQLICDFLGEDAFEDVSLNPGNDQRLIMVAAQFRKEVTSTVLWLLKHGVFVKCFRATPFQDGDAIFLNMEQVIPLPEAEPVSLPVERLAHLGAVGMVTVYSFLAHRHISFAGGFRKRLRARTTMVS